MTNNKIKVLVIPSDTMGGIWAHRTLNPHVRLQELFPDEFDVQIVKMPDIPKDNLDQWLKGFDLVVFHKQLDKQGKLLNMIKFLDSSDTPIATIQDLDDYWSLGADHPMAVSARRENWKADILNHTKNVDCVTTPSAIYAKEIKKYNTNVAILPNALNPDDPQFSTKKNDNGRLNFGIVCGSTHMKDIELMQGINYLPKETLDKICVNLCGFDTNGVTTVYKPDGSVERRPIKPEESIWVKYEEFITNNYKNIENPEYVAFLKQYMKGVDTPEQFKNEWYQRHWTKDIHHYGEHYQNVDVLLAPLKENDFNKMKSFLKQTEAGITNTAIIVSDFGPYTIDTVPFNLKGGIIDENGTSIVIPHNKDNKWWKKWIITLTEHPEYVQKLKDNLRKQQIEKYSLDVVTKQRADVYRNVVKEHRAKFGLQS